MSDFEETLTYMQKQRHLRCTCGKIDNWHAKHPEDCPYRQHMDEYWRKREMNPLVSERKENE
jgi:hypothetical protein